MKLRIKKYHYTNGYLKEKVYKRQFKLFGFWFTYKKTYSV